MLIIYIIPQQAIFVNTAAAFLHYFKFDHLFTKYHKYAKTKCIDGTPVQHRRRCSALKIAGAIRDGKPNIRSTHSNPLPKRADIESAPTEIGVLP